MSLLSELDALAEQITADHGRDIEAIDRVRRLASLVPAERNKQNAPRNVGQRKAQQRRRETSTDAGKCTRCGKPKEPGRERYKTCIACRDAAYIAAPKVTAKRLADDSPTRAAANTPRGGSFPWRGNGDLNAPAETVAALADRVRERLADEVREYLKDHDGRSPIHDIVRSVGATRTEVETALAVMRDVTLTAGIWNLKEGTDR